MHRDVNLNAGKRTVYVHAHRETEFRSKVNAASFGENGIKKVGEKKIGIYDITFFLESVVTLPRYLGAQ